MSRKNPTRRSYGSGSLYTRADANGVETWYGRWYVAGERKKAALGRKRAPGSGQGLTRAQAEAELRRRTGETPERQRVGERLTVAQVGERYRAHAERRGRKPSTIGNIESELRVHLVPVLGGLTLDSITPERVLGLVASLENRGLSPKSIRNVIGTLSAMFNYAKAPQRRWASQNPCEGLELPAAPERTEIRFLTLEQVNALVVHARPGMFQHHDRALYRTAAMTGLRKGELLALRWMDIDWAAQRVRVRQNYVRGQFGTPKSRRSTRSVPMADEVGAELERLFQASRHQRDHDLVFAHPATGGPLAKANVSRRMTSALKDAGLHGGHRFHDLRHTFGTRMAAAGVPLRTLQEWLGHRDLQTTQIYADYAPSAREAELVAAAFAPEPIIASRARGPVRGPFLSEPQVTSEDLNPRKHGEPALA